MKNDIILETKSNQKLKMYEIIRKNWDKNKYLIISGFFAISLVLLTVVYKNDEIASKMEVPLF